MPLKRKNYPTMGTQNMGLIGDSKTTPPYPAWMIEMMEMWDGITSPHLDTPDLETSDDYSERVPDPFIETKVNAICMKMIEQHLDPTCFIFTGYINRAGGPMVPVTETPKLFVREYNEYSKKGVGEWLELGTINNATSIQLAIGMMMDHYDLDGK